MNNKFMDQIHTGKILLADGATGSNLQQRGLPNGKPGELWVLENPDEIVRLETDFIHAGADIILTCTFGASRLHLGQMGLANESERINRTAVELARKAAAAGGVLVAGSIGPIGQMLEPFGTLSAQDAEITFAEQARWLAESGVDMIVIETQFDLGEAEVAVRAVRSVTTLPLVCSFSYDRGTKTMMGVSPAKAARALNDSGVDLLGINCGRSLDDNLKALRELREATTLPIWFKPNAGLPVVDESGNAVYQTTPQQMAENVTDWIAAGAQVIGGCCGTSPEHLAAVAEVVRTYR